MSIKDMVSNNKQVFFVRYEDDNLWYQTECGFEFPVPTADTNEAAFVAQDKAMLFMKWIRKQIEVVKNDPQVFFVRYQTGEFWYKTESDFEFPVPASDSNEINIVSKDKSSKFIKWIKKHEDMLNIAKKEQLVA